MSEQLKKQIKKEHQPIQPSTIKQKTNFRNTVYDCVKNRGWKETESEDWELLWADRDLIHDVFDHQHLQSNQRVNHFRNHQELTRKDLMIKNLKRYKKALEKEGKFDEASQLNFFPTTQNLPSDYSLFVEEFKRSVGGLWIMKPIGKAQGKGIFLFNKLPQINQWKNEYRYKPDNPQAEPYIVQKYIEKPLLIGGKKFDLRIQVLVISQYPLTVQLYRSGFARFTNIRQNANTDDISNNFVHLTNVAIQKTSENYDEKTGGKWDLRGLKLQLMSLYGIEKTSDAFSDIQNCVIKSLNSVQKSTINDKHCFELYGQDILLDENLKAWLIEVNASPSLTANTQQDYDMKINMLDDVMTILDFEKILTGSEEQIGGFDLICKGNLVNFPSNSTYQTTLGCMNNRDINMKKLAKSCATRLAQQHTDNENTDNHIISKKVKKNSKEN